MMKKRYFIVVFVSPLGYWQCSFSSIFGWTMNLTRPAAWVLILGGIAITVGFIAIIAILV